MIVAPRPWPARSAHRRRRRGRRRSTSRRPSQGCGSRAAAGRGRCGRPPVTRARRAGPLRRPSRDRPRGSRTCAWPWRRRLSRRRDAVLEKVSGGRPVTARKSLIRCDWSKYPHSTAIRAQSGRPGRCASVRARSKRSSRATAFGGNPTCSRNRATIRLRLQPSSSASEPIGTRPLVSTRCRHAQSTPGDGARAAARRRISTWSRRSSR